MHTAVSLAVASLRTGKNCGFTAAFSAPELAGLHHLGRIACEGQRYSLPKFGLSEAEHLLGRARPPKIGNVAEKLPRAQVVVVVAVIIVGGAYSYSSQADIFTHH